MRGGIEPAGKRKELVDRLRDVVYSFGSLAHA